MKRVSEYVHSACEKASNDSKDCTVYGKVDSD